MSEMSPPPLGEPQRRIYDLEVETRALRRKLAQREAALAVLNRRLLVLERGGTGVSGVSRVDEERTASVEDELQRLRDTKLFRWSAPARDIYRSLRSASRPR
ncbi:MAG: hypothetical protein M3137_03085 [Actinomycetota bacterium]|nr:hypothetical protein [Actinomycetota bacterium]